MNREEEKLTCARLSCPCIVYSKYLRASHLNFSRFAVSVRADCHFRIMFLRAARCFTRFSSSEHPRISKCRFT